VNRVERLVSEDSVVDFIFVLAAEWRLLKKHLIDEHTEGPPVDSSTVFLVEKDLPELLVSTAIIGKRRFSIYLRSHEFWGSAKSACGAPIPHFFLAQTVISDLDMAVKGEKDVVEFQVAIYDTVLMEVL
jgi:hypothetical protein